MRSIVLRLAATAVCACMAGLLPAAALADPPPDAAVADLVAHLLPMAVQIEAVHYSKNNPNPADPRPYNKITEDGSGFIIDPSGLVITNHHVIAGAQTIDVVLHDRTRLRADLIYSAPIDMVLLKIQAHRPLPAITWGDSDEMRQGDPVIAIGNPLGIGISVSAGVISALDRNIGETQAAIKGGRDVDSMLQTDAALNHGNSGGPLFNLAGQVIGINTALISPTAASAGLGFAIPSRDALFILDEYKRYGRVRPGFIGATVQPMNQDLAASVLLPGPPHGVMVDVVEPAGPAERAGLQTGDVILTIRGVPINDARDYTRAVLATQFDTTQAVTIWRDRAQMVLPVYFTEGPDSQPEVKATPVTDPATPHVLNAAAIGVELEPLTPELRKTFNIAPSAHGVVISKVIPLSIAYERGAEAGDVIEQFQNTEVHTPKDLQDAAAAARSANLSYARILLKQGDKVRWIAVPLFSNG